MSLSIFISNSIPQLAEAMIDTLGTLKGNVFHPTYLVTQTQGMNNWLKFQIAEQLGIAANLKFQSPAEIVFEVYKILDGPYTDKINRQHLDWLVFSVLSQHNFIELYPNQSAYYFENAQRDEMKQWEFAAKVADLFDQYQIYRSAIIQEWNTSDVKSLKVEQQWQAFIWKELKRKTANAVMDITETQDYILYALKDENKRRKLEQKIPQIYLFGLSIITPFHLQIFHALAQYIHIQWYIGNPSPDNYWFEDQKEETVFLKQMQGKKIAHINIGNSLLTSWGKVLQNTFRMFFQTEEFINAVMDLPSTAPQTNTLLGKIQNQIFENTTETPRFGNALLTDGSVTITSNYSIRREVETVYNYLLKAILNQQFGDIKERDIIVMVSDINAYAPFIKAVMDNAPYKFQYSIADESISNGDTIITALIAILELHGAIFSAEAVLQLLSFKNIRNKFGIYNVKLIRNVVQQANIKFGIDNDYRNNIDDTYLVSWKYGLQKIMFGLCMAEEQRMEQDKTFYTIESSDSAEDMQQITAFTALVETLMSNVQKRTQAKTLNAWKTYIEDTLNDLLLSDEADKDERYTQIIQKFKQNDIIDQLLNEEKISYEVFNNHFINGLSNETFQGKFLSRGITFCSPLPFRSIPFKVVAILGLNYDSFPRKEQHLDFDIMSKSPQLGDRNIKNNDKHLFLESVLSAGDALYLSYIGCSVRDNKPLPPSLLIDELLDYIQSGNKNIDVRATLVEAHPLQSYSKKYNRKNSSLLPNYLIQNARKWPLGIKKSEAIPAPPITECKIDLLWKFYDKAIKYYYNNVLQIYFEQEASEIKDNEVFVLDHLQKWSLRQELLQGKLSNKEHETEEQLYLNAQLPLKNVGKSVLNSTDETLQRLTEQFKSDFENTQDISTLSIQYHYKDVKFHGKLNNIYENKLVAFAFGKAEKAKSKLMLHYLFAKVTNDDIAGATLYHIDGKTELKTISQDEAEKALHQILNSFLKLNTEAVLYSLNTHSDKMKAENFVEELNKTTVKKSGYDDYITHALETLDIEEHKQYFQILNPVITEIFLNTSND